MPSTVPGTVWGGKAEGLKSFYLREKDLEFLMDLRLWLGEEAVRRRRGWLWQPHCGVGGVVLRQTGARRMPASSLPSCVTRNKGLCFSSLSFPVQKNGLLCLVTPGCLPSPASSLAPVPDHSLMGNGALGLGSQRLAFQSQNIAVTPVTLSKVLLLTEFFFPYLGSGRTPLPSKVGGATTETIYVNVPHAGLGVNIRCDRGFRLFLGGCLHVRSHFKENLIFLSLDDHLETTHRKNPCTEPGSSCVDLGKSFHLPEPQLSQLQRGTDVTCVTGCCAGDNDNKNHYCNSNKDDGHGEGQDPASQPVTVGQLWRGRNLGQWRRPLTDHRLQTHLETLPPPVLWLFLG